MKSIFKPLFIRRKSLKWAVINIVLYFITFLYSSYAMEELECKISSNKNISQSSFNKKALILIATNRENYRKYQTSFMTTNQAKE